MFSFEMNKVNTFCGLTAPFSLIPFSNLFIVFKSIFITNTEKLSIVKRIAAFLTDFLSKLRNLERKDTLD